MPRRFLLLAEVPLQGTPAEADLPLLLDVCLRVCVSGLPGRTADTHPRRRRREHQCDDQLLQRPLAHPHHYDHRWLRRLLPADPARQSHHPFRGHLGHPHRLHHAGRRHQHPQHGGLRNQNRQDLGQVGVKGTIRGKGLKIHWLFFATKAFTQRKKSKEGLPA
jgi:hypothetical protein